MRDRYRDRVRFIEARGVSYAHTFPYWPIRDLLREWLGVGATTPEARVRLELKAELAHLLGKEEAEEAYPFLASLIGVTLEPEAQGAIRELNREGIQSRTFEVFSELVYKLADEEPLCLVFEDLHWADESTLELLETLLGMTDEAAVALFFLYRPEREHGSWRLGERARQRYPHRYREIEVRPLPADSARVLVSHAAAGRAPGVGGRAPGRALGRESVLPRGGDPRPDRAGRARAPERRLAAGGRRGRAGDPGGGAGHAPGAARPARA